jgi:hypothetical protein
MSQQNRSSSRDVPTSAGPSLEGDDNPQERGSLPTTPERPTRTPAASRIQEEEEEEEEDSSYVQAPRGMPVHPGQVERRPPSDLQRSMIQEPLQSTIARQQDPANRLLATVSSNCLHGRDHEMGMFCHECRGIQMPWGTSLPRVRDDLGEDLRRGPNGSIFQGVQLQNFNAIATLSTRAYLQLTHQSAMSIDGFNGFEARYKAASNAGRLVARLIDSLRRVATNLERVPAFYDIIHQALLEPDLSYENHRENILRIIETDEENERPHGHDNAARGARGEGLGGIASRHGRRQSQASASSGNLEIGPGGTTSAPSGSSSSPTDNSEELIFEPMRDISGPQSHRPPKRGDWEFVQGTDLSDAVLGQPDPSKYFLVRQMHSNPAEKDVRQYPGWAKMDWNDPTHITDLNRARRQIRMRTSGAIAEPRLPWTKLEKDVLKRLVQNAINAGQKRTTIDWEAISSNMSKHFDSLVQKEGEPLAQTTTVVGGIEQAPKYKRAPKLKTQRKGSQQRGAKALANQAEKYGDIWIMLNNTQPRKDRKKKRTAGGSNKQDSESPEYQDEDVAEDVDSDDEPIQPKPKRVKGPKDMPDRGPKKPPGPPPPGGAGGLAGPMGKSRSIAPTRTPMAAR